MDHVDMRKKHIYGVDTIKSDYVVAISNLIDSKLYAHEIYDIATGNRIKVKDNIDMKDKNVTNVGNILTQTKFMVLMEEIE